jgi:hypothetical protein
VAIFSAVIPTGTTADIAVTFTDPLFNDMYLSTYAVDDALMVSSTPQIGTPATGTSSTSATTGSFTQGANGFNIGVLAVSTAVSAEGATGYTEDMAVAARMFSFSQDGPVCGERYF